MAITHPSVKAPGEKVFAIADWNANHVADTLLIANLNADLLDGQHAAAFLTSETDPVFTAWDKDHADLSNVTATQHHSNANDHVNALIQHAITLTTAHTSAATSGQMLKADANGLPINATNTDVEVAGAVTHAADNTQAHSDYLLNTGDTAEGAYVFNEAGADVNFRIEGDTDANLFFVEATNPGYVGIGTATPSARLDVVGDIEGSGYLWAGSTVEATTNVIEGTRGQFFAYRTTAFAIAATNTWYDYPWNILAPVKQGFTHTHNGANPEQITVTNGGTYQITYGLNDAYNTNALLWTMRILDDGTEIPGSYVQDCSQYGGFTSNTIIAKIAANSVIELQVGGNLAGVGISYYDNASMPNPTTFVSGRISITKLSNDA